MKPVIKITYKTSLINLSRYALDKIMNSLDNERMRISKDNVEFCYYINDKFIK